MCRRCYILAAILAALLWTSSTISHSGRISVAKHLNQAIAIADLGELYRSLFDTADSDGVRKLIDSHDPAISIAASWEQVRRSIPDGYIANRRVDSERLGRFLELVEDNLKVKAPPFWSSAVKSAMSDNRRRIWFSARAEGTPCNAVGSNTFCIPRAAIIRRHKALKFEWDNQEWEIPDISQERFHIIGTATGTEVCFAAMTWPPNPYRLYSCSRQSKDRKWTTTVQAYGTELSTAGIGWHNAAIIASGNELIVLGASSETLYIEVFSITSGVPLWKFGTSYFSRTSTK